MSATAIRAALVAQLRKLPVDAKPNLAEIRRAIGCTLGELQAAVQSLRFVGKLAWDRLELSPSMRAEPEDDYPSEVNDVAAQGARGASEQEHEPGAEQTNAPERVHGADPAGDSRTPCAPEGGGHSSPDRAAALPRDHAAEGRRLTNSRAAARPVPAPRHESEVDRIVREEANDLGQRRRSARSTATVSRPLAMYRRGELDLAETVQSLMAEAPHDVILAINRRHQAAWARIVALGRLRGERPAAALYAVLEAGLDALEPMEMRDVA